MAAHVLLLSLRINIAVKFFSHESMPAICSTFPLKVELHARKIAAPHMSCLCHTCLLSNSYKGPEFDERKVYHKSLGGKFILVTILIRINQIQQVFQALFQKNSNLSGLSAINGRSFSSGRPITPLRFFIGFFWQSEVRQFY